MFGFIVQSIIAALAGVLFALLAAVVAPLWLFPLLQPLVRFLERRKASSAERVRAPRCSSD